MLKGGTVHYLYWRDGDWIVGQLQEYPGVISQGRTIEELESNLEDAFYQYQKQPRKSRSRAVPGKKYKIKQMKLLA